MFLIKDIKLQNFRSHSFTELKTNHPIICIIGPNGSGKTNVLEAISLIADKKGIRGTLIEDCIKKDSKDKTIISTTISYEKKDYKVDVIFESKENKVKKYLNIDNNKSSLAEVFKDINFIWLTPQMDKIMYEGDSIKRKFLDKIISNYNLDYKKNLSNFKKLSEERIQLLKENNFLLVRTSDDGIGYDFEKIKSANKLGLGLLGIFSRVEYLNGSIISPTNSSKGTKYNIRIPI